MMNPKRKEQSVQKKAATKTTKTAKVGALITQDFFPAGIEVNINKMFPMLVMATMSSGKSTLINALLGQQILPSKNEACTAKMYSILDDDQDTDLRLYITDTAGNTKIKEENLAEELSKANQDDAVSDIFIRGHVEGILNTSKALLIVDTPGPNNSMDLSHEKIMRDVLNKVNGGLILYVMNATQLGINDDKYLLRVLNEYRKTHMMSKVLFVINKVDQIDEERESVEQLVLAARDYLVENGFDGPELIPVSALAASIFKKVLNEDELTRKEYRFFEEFYELYKPKDFNMKSYAITEEYPDQYKMIEVRGETYKTADLVRAIENTGIKLLEENIQKAQILSGGQLKNSIRIKRRRRSE